MRYCGEVGIGGSGCGGQSDDAISWQPVNGGDISVADHEEGPSFGIVVAVVVAFVVTVVLNKFKCVVVIIRF